MLKLTRAAQLLACSGVVVVHRVLVGRPGVASLTRGRVDLTGIPALAGRGDRRRFGRLRNCATSASAS